MTNDEEAHLAVGAYLLHALPPDEAAAYERHLASCAACRREVAELGETVGELAGSQTAALPPGLRERVFAEIARAPQDRSASRPHLPARLRRRGLVLALAASLAAAAAFGGIAAWQHARADDARTQVLALQTDKDAFAGVLTAPDATLYTGNLTGGTSVAVVVSREGDRAAFAAEDLPALRDDQVYELWYAARSGDLTPAGLLPGRGGRPARVLDRPLGSAVAVGITVEPEGGSTRPTTDPLGIIPITA
ncbi:anti-sigma factor [Streptomyces bobili]|uniref:anti-sigma factor n=1 Tax=Streptomyces bobili TaxID=67280 RepID=UPI0033B11F40